MRAAFHLFVVLLPTSCMDLSPLESERIPAALGPESSTILVMQDGTIVVLDTDHDALVFLDPQDRTRRSDLRVGIRPAQMTIRGDIIIVTNKGDRTLTVVDAPSRTVLRTVPIGVEPNGVLTLDERHALVALEGEDALTLVDYVSGDIQHRIPVATRPHGLARVGNVVFVSHLPGGTITQLGIGDWTSLQTADGGANTCCQISRDVLSLATMTASVDGRGILVPAVIVNDAAQQYYQGAAVRPASPVVARLEVGANGAIRNTTVLPGQSDPVACASLQDGQGMATLYRGVQTLTFYRLQDTLPGAVAVAYASAGHGADGIALSPDGTRVYVRNAFDLSVTEVHIPNLAPPTKRRSFSAVKLPSQTYLYAIDTLPPDVTTGRRLFHDATRQSLSQNGLTCATCHIGGRNDGRTWSTPAGRRNTPSLAGAAPGRRGIATTTAPLHWDGELDTHRDLRLTMVQVMGGDGKVDDADMDALGAFIDTIPEPDNRFRDDPLLQTLRARGEAIFYSASVGCSVCHAGPHRTDNLSHDGFGLLQGSQGDHKFQTPPLIGLAWTAPYFHDGSCSSLRNFVERYVKTDVMGRGSHLSPEDLRALEVFLLSL